MNGESKKEYYVRKYYKIFKNILKMMEIRGYHFLNEIEGSTGDKPSFEEFRTFVLEDDDKLLEIWLQFIKPDDVKVRVHFTFEAINTKKHVEITDDMNAYLDMEPTKRLHIILLYNQKMTSGPNVVFKEIQPNNQPRNIPIKGLTIEIYHQDFFLINPLKHVLQPKITLMFDEEKKKVLHDYLVRDIAYKDKLLEDLCPLIYVQRPVCIWLGARVGDILLFDNGEIRAVVNEPHSSMFKYKVKEQDDEMFQ